MRVTPERIHFSQIEDGYPLQVPSVQQPVNLGGNLDDLLQGGDAKVQDAKIDLVVRELQAISRAIRSHERFGSPLHVLFRADDLTAPQIAGHLGQDPRDVEFQLDQLEEFGLVRSIRRGTTLARYSITGQQPR